MLSCFPSFFLCVFGALEQTLGKPAEAEPAEAEQAALDAEPAGSSDPRALRRCKREPAEAAADADMSGDDVPMASGRLAELTARHADQLRLSC